MKDGSITLKIGGPADMFEVSAALVKVNSHFNGAEFNSAFSFAVSYLATMIVLSERCIGTMGGFDYDELTETLRAAVRAGHDGPRIGTLS